MAWFQLSGGGPVDLGFIGGAIRLIDYAHINHDRASQLDRALRSDISSESLVHWDAQTGITGPMRQDEWLVYGVTKPLQNVDAWWLFYELAKGLDNEIRAVRDYLSERAASSGRLSLRGVRSVESAESFATLIQLDGTVAPIDIRIQPD